MDREEVFKHPYDGLINNNLTLYGGERGLSRPRNLIGNVTMQHEEGVDIIYKL